MNDLSAYFLPYQLAWINEQAPLALGQKSRRIGWTYASSFRAVERRVKDICNLYFSSADLTAAREFIDYCKTWCGVFNAVAEESSETAVIDDAQITTLVLTFSNGRKIVAGSSNPKFFRSKGGDADLDEFAFHRDGRELYKAAHATALFWGYQLRAWSTHNGEGSYYNQLVQAALHEPPQIKAAVQTVTILDAVDQGIVEKIKRLPARDDKARQEWLDELHGTCPDEDTWNEEYLCRPSSDQSSLLTYDLIRGCEASNLPVNEDLARLPQSGELYAGGDIGRKHDLTVCWVDEKIGDVYWNRLLRRMRGVKFSEQEGFFNQLLSNRAVRRLCLDETGIGMDLCERLVQRWGPHRVEPVMFTAASKSGMAMPLVRRFQDKASRIPAEDALRESLHSVRKSVTAAGNIRLDADRTDDGHADEFWAAALASEASDQAKVPLPPPMLRKPVGW